MKYYELITVWRNMYPFVSAVVAGIIAQLIKPFIYYFFQNKEWRWYLMLASGGFPSSHTAIVIALALAVGLQERFRSPIFAVAMTMAIIVIYDAANVRYYSGQNIKVTQQLIKDLKEIDPVEFNDPIYQTKMKEVLGHKWREIFGGIIIGILVALIFHHFL